MKRQQKDTRRIPPNVCHEILPHLLLGSQAATQYAEMLGVQLIVSIGARCKIVGIDNVHIGLKDNNEINIQDELHHVTSLIMEQIGKQRKVLLHCQAGINRSPSFALAVVCKHFNMSTEDGMRFIISKRRICRFSFKDQVAVWLTVSSAESSNTANDQQGLDVTP